MIGRLNHVAIAVKDLAKASAVYKNALGAKVGPSLAQPEHGVTVVFLERAHPNFRTQRSSCSSRSAKVRRSQNSSKNLPTVGFTMYAMR